MCLFESLGSRKGPSLRWPWVDSDLSSWPSRITADAVSSRMLYTLYPEKLQRRHHAATLRGSEQVLPSRQLHPTTAPLPPPLCVIVRRKVDAPRQACMPAQVTDPMQLPPSKDKIYVVRYYQSIYSIKFSLAPAPRRAGARPAYSAVQPSWRTMLLSACRVPRYTGSDL